jgi:hypothetical protein
MRFLYFGVLLAVLSVSVSAKEPAADTPSRLNPKCDAPESRDFDFWVGNWDLRVRQRIGLEGEEFREGKAISTVRPILDGCVLLEEIEGDKLPRPVLGMSVSTFNSKTGKWQQTWVDNSANNMIFEGGYVNGRMEMIHKAIDDRQTVLWRITFHNVDEDQFDWAYDRSTDGGRTWLNFMQIHYTRNTAGPLI